MSLNWDADKRLYVYSSVLSCARAQELIGCQLCSGFEEVTYQADSAAQDVIVRGIYCSVIALSNTKVRNRSPLLKSPIN